MRALDATVRDVLAKLPKALKGSKGAAMSLLQDDASSASGIYAALRVLYKQNWLLWEHETVWVTLLKESGVNLSNKNRQKALAAKTLLMVPAFWWDAAVFENTALAFNSAIVDVTILQEATPGQLNWAVFETSLLFNALGDISDTPAFDYEPMGYAAAVLHRAGFIQAPEFLSFAQESLTKLNRDGTSVTEDAVRSAWDDYTKEKTKRELTDSSLDVQLTHLATVDAYMEKRLKRLNADLELLTSQ